MDRLSIFVGAAYRVMYVAQGSRAALSRSVTRVRITLRFTRRSIRNQVRWRERFLLSTCPVAINQLVYLVDVVSPERPV